MFPRGGWEVVVDIITISGYLYYLHYYLDCGVFGKLNKLLKLVLVSFLSRVRYDTITLFYIQYFHQSLTKIKIKIFQKLKLLFVIFAMW